MLKVLLGFKTAKEMKSRKSKKIKELMKMNKCRYCLSTENLTVDHKVPIVQGGTDEFKNLQCLCKRCNGIKSGLSHKQVKHLAKWILEINEGRALKGKRPFGYRKDKLPL